MTDRRLSTKRTLVSSIDRAIKIQFDGGLLMDKCEPNGAKNCGQSALFHRFTQWEQLSIHADSGRFKEEVSTIGSSNVYLSKRASLDKLTCPDRIGRKAKAPGKIVKGP